MKQNSYTEIHYSKELRPYSNYSYLLCRNLSDNYFKSRAGTLLDVGCGRGEFVEIFNSLGFDAYGVDLEANSPKTQRVDLETETLPFPDDHFDYIMCKSTIEHVRNVYHLVDEMHRVLKPNGKIVIMTGDWKAIHHVFYLDVDHKTPFMKCSLHDLLLRYNFRNVQVDYFYCLPYTWKNKYLKIIPWMVAFFIRVDFAPTVKLNMLIKQLKFSRERQIIGYAEKEA